MKRKASGKINDERPAKIVKEDTTATLEGTLNAMLRIDSVQKPALSPVKLSSIRKRKVAVRRQPTVKKVPVEAMESELLFPSLTKSATVKMQEGGPSSPRRTRSGQKSIPLTKKDTIHLASSSSKS
uniref:Uncharacterized protein n=1 Tax=Arion vulgaris TaxID=1028688 RepID=A0A0B6ZSQ2_9EUPU